MPIEHVWSREAPVATSKPEAYLRERRSDGLPLPSILLASAGRPFDPAVIKEAIAAAREPKSYVHVLTIARIFGTGLGLQHPGLLPTKREWQQQADIVASAVKALKAAGLEASGGVIATRNASKVIAREGKRLGCRGIVIGAPTLSWWMYWLLQDEARWVRWRSKIPVLQVPYGLGA